MVRLLSGRDRVTHTHIYTHTYVHAPYTEGCGRLRLACVRTLRWVCVRLRKQVSLGSRRSVSPPAAAVKEGRI